jgi:hypothetical protein
MLPEHVLDSLLMGTLQFGIIYLKREEFLSGMTHPSLLGMLQIGIRA